MTVILLLVGIAGFWAGAQNALAGGGSFITFPVLLFAGLAPRAANITSTLALFPGQIAMSWSGRRTADGVRGLSLPALVVLSFAGGIVGALLLLATPASRPTIQPALDRGAGRSWIHSRSR